MYNCCTHDCRMIRCMNFECYSCCMQCSWVYIVPNGCNVFDSKWQFSVPTCVLNGWLYLGMAHKTIHADYVIHYQIVKMGLSGSARNRQTNHSTMALPNTQHSSYYSEVKHQTLLILLKLRLWGIPMR